MSTSTTDIVSLPGELVSVVTSLISTLREVVQSKNQATVITLQGDLGAGKTTFVQTLGRALGVTETITSPTFVVMKSYELPEDPHWDTLVHIDAYRFEQGTEALALRLPELCSLPRTLICIEWPQRLNQYAPVATLALHFTYVDQTTRSLTTTYGQI